MAAFPLEKGHEPPSHRPNPMTLAFQSMMMAVLVVCGAVAAIPSLLRPSEPRLPPPLHVGLQQPGLWLVENSKGQWFVNGGPSAKSHIVSMVEKQARRQVIHYLPSDALPLERVGSSLRWLRSIAPNSVVLELSPQQFSSTP